MRQILLVSAILIGFFAICAQAPSIVATPTTPLTNDEALTIAVDFAYNRLKNIEHLSGGFVGHTDQNEDIIPICVLNAIKDSKTLKYREEDYLIFVDKTTKLITESFIIPLDNDLLAKMNPEILKRYNDNCADRNGAVLVEGPKK
jgi:hypothetical protein